MGNWRPPGWRDPQSYALSVTGAVVLALGVLVFDSIIWILLGLGMVLGGGLLSWTRRRS